MIKLIKQNKFFSNIANIGKFINIKSIINRKENIITVINFKVKELKNHCFTKIKKKTIWLLVYSFFLLGKIISLFFKLAKNIIFNLALELLHTNIDNANNPNQKNFSQLFVEIIFMSQIRKQKLFFFRCCCCSQTSIKA